MKIPNIHGCEEWKIYHLLIRPLPASLSFFPVMSTPSSSKNWYAFKVFFNKVFEIAELLEKSHIESYFPTETVVVVKNGRKKKELKPVISSLLFIKCTLQEVIEQQRLLTDRVILYTHFTEAGKVPAQIPNDEMERFKLVASSGQEGLEFFGNDCEEFHRGEHVGSSTDLSREPKATFAACATTTVSLSPSGASALWPPPTSLAAIFRKSTINPITL